VVVIEVDSSGSQLAVTCAEFSEAGSAGDRRWPQARLARIGDVWVVSGDERSPNGAFLNSRRLLGSARLRNGDVLRSCGVAIAFRETQAHSKPVLGSADMASPVVSTAEQRVLEALVRPWIASAGMAAPAANAEIAEELVLSVHTVKSHMRKLFERFELGNIARSRKRTALADAALRAGLLERAIGS